MTAAVFARPKQTVLGTAGKCAGSGKMEKSCHIPVLGLSKLRRER